MVPAPKSSLLTLLTTVSIVSGLAAAPGLAQGWVIIEEPGRQTPPVPGAATLVLKDLRITAQINDGAAVTDVQQIFQNPTAQQVEGTYLLPLPDNVAVGDFAMTVGGKTLRGEVLDAGSARRTYEDIVRRLRDPGLLEYVGGRLFRARIFPIAPHGTVEVGLRYSQTIAEQAGLGQFCHPLRVDCLQAAPISHVSLSATIRSQLPLAAVFSPSHRCEVSRPSANQALVAYEAVNVVLDRDFLVYYQRQDTDLAMVLLKHRPSGEDGTFMLRIAPRVDLAERRTLPKDIAFVIDTSGSMEGAKIEQTRRALKFCIGSLRPVDRFNIYSFSTGVRPFRQSLVPANDEIRQAARQFADDLQANGGTNINAALLAALADDPRDEQRPYLIVFMTDGLPTVEVTDAEQICRNVLAANQRNVRFHVLGVGSDVNTHLLDKLAEATRGSRDYCTEKEDLELKLSALTRRLSHPALTDLRLHVNGVRVYDVYPSELPDLFCGDDLVVLGRYEGWGTAHVCLEGQVAGQAQVVAQSVDFPAVETTADFLPRLWANRKVAYLLDQIRLHGQRRELRDEVVKLAKRYGIVTPYTAALIVEEDAAPSSPPEVVLRPLAERARSVGGGDGLFGMGAPAPATGAPAVACSARLENDKSASALGDDVDDQVPTGDGRVVRYVGDKTFVLAGGRWTDSIWDGRSQPQKVQAFSDEYFELLSRRPELRRYFALGERVLVVIGDQVYETI